MKQLLFILLSVLLFTACSTSRNSRSSSSAVTPRAITSSTAPSGNIQLDYVQQYKNIAMSEMQRAGIPASITLAQGILESASGRSELASNANNHFGIKCAGNWTGKTFYKKDDDRGADGQLIESCFRKYNDAQESFFDHSEFLRDPRKSNRYGFLFNLDKRDYKSWARGLQSSGYATSQIYADQLIDLIERLRLYEYDQPGVVDIKPGEIIPESVPPQNRIGRVNDVKVVNTRPGETIADIARIYNLQADKVADYNDRAYTPAEYVPPGTRIFIQKKQKSWRGQATHHFVKEGQTMLEIAQLYGIRLDNLLKCNNLQPGQEPAADEKIRLRGKRDSNEKIRLRDATGTPKPTTQPTGPVTMTPDDDVLFEETPPTTQPTTKPSDPVIPGKPATTGVPLPPDPVPANPNPPTPTTQPQPNIPAPQPTPTTQQPVPSGYHQVVKGDTLYNISKRYNTTVAKLKELNNLRSDYIQIGQTLRVR
ncbi:MAG: LysM peptidoglycan-binding domain-containing protein [Saprospiraceae bacterium]